MPLYDFRCRCGYTEERYVGSYEPKVTCPECKAEMAKMPGSNIMVKVKGEGGYPSRRKQVFNTTKQTHPSLEHKKNKTIFS